MPLPELPRVIDRPLAVVGDLHGAAGLLELLLARLRQVPGFEDRWIVFAGDFLDRGPDSRRCLDMVLDLLDRDGKVAACMGNHDLAAIGSMGLVPTPASSHWHMRYVADYESWPTFASYGVAVSEEGFDDLADAVRDIKPFYDPNDDSFTGGVVPDHLVGLRDEVSGVWMD